MFSFSGIRHWHYYMDFDHGFVFYINCKLVDLSCVSINTICIIIICFSVIDYHYFSYAHQLFLYLYQFKLLYFMMISINYLHLLKNIVFFEETTVSFERFNTVNCQRALHNIDLDDNNQSYYLYPTTNLIGIFLLFISLINLVIDSFNQVYYFIALCIQLCIALNSSITDCISCIFVLSYCQSSRVGGMCFKINVSYFPT